MSIYDIAVVGGGPAGSMAAIRAGLNGRKVILVERNGSIGKKILITGKGRCNITNSAPMAQFIEEFGKAGQFLRTAFSKFSNEDLVDFFKQEGLGMKVERQGRVFPVTDKASSVVDTLKACLSKAGVEVRCNTRITDIGRDGDGFLLKTESGGSIHCGKVVVTTGGASYKATGSSGDGWDFARRLGHSIAPMLPALVPMRTKESWVKDLQGLTLKNIRITFSCGRKRIISGIGEMLFTHFGVSGPLILDSSLRLVLMLEEFGEIGLFIDLKPGLDRDKIEAKILSDIKTMGNKALGNFFKSYLPSGLVDTFLKIAGVPAGKKANQMTQAERRAIVGAFKAFPLTITGALPLEEAMVTAGGVSRKEINPRTMESRLSPGLYFAGEIIEGGASSGGYNLQQAFSTGYLAGEAAANA